MLIFCLSGQPHFFLFSKFGMYSRWTIQNFIFWNLVQNMDWNIFTFKTFTFSISLCRSSAFYCSSAAMQIVAWMEDQFVIDLDTSRLEHLACPVSLNLMWSFFLDQLLLWSCSLPMCIYDKEQITFYVQWYSVLTFYVHFTEALTIVKFILSWFQFPLQ